MKRNLQVIAVAILSALATLIVSDTLWPRPLTCPASPVLQEVNPQREIARRNESNRRVFIIKSNLVCQQSL